MKSQLLFLGKLLLVWILFFSFQRLLFIFHFFGDFSGNYWDLFTVPFHGFRLDLSGFSYIMAIPFILSVPGFVIHSEKWLNRLNRIILIFIWIVFVAAALIMAGEIVTYIEWKTKLSSKIFIHFGTPSEIFRTASGGYTFWFILYFILQLIFGWLIYNRLFRRNKLKVVATDLWKKITGGVVYFLSGAFLFALGIRGGLQEIPISATDAYFSKEQIVNDVTVNPVWNFIHMTYTHLKVDLDHYFQNLPIEESERIRKELYAAEPCDTVKVLNTDLPNIILLTLEGWSAQMIEPLGGPEGITPNFNKLCEEGLLFTEIYSTGGTSETGHSSIISGYPTISGISISTESAKCRKLPALNQSLEAEGYSTFYTFGGSLSYGNIGGYLTDVGFDRLVDENDLDLEPKGKLGIHDEAMFPYFLSEVQKAKRPYFYGLFTQSTHSPYDMPAEPFPGYEEDGYVTSMHYADEHLGKFIEGIRNLPDFENTLVIMIADHGRTHTFNENTYDEDYFHIPLLIWGGALDSAYMNYRIENVGSQADLAKTLLNQLGLNSDAYHWSKDLLNPNTKDWAICTSTLSYGWKDSTGYTIYQMIEDRLIDSPYDDPAKTEEALRKCRAVLESMYREFKEL